MVLTPFLDGLFGLPMEFVGVAIGLITSVLILMMLAFFARMEGLVLGWVAVFLCVMNFVLFAWPLWPIAVVGVAALFQFLAPTRQVFASGPIDVAELVPIMLMVVSAVVVLGFWPPIVAAPLFLLVGFMLYASVKGDRNG